jgi:hypothetical protein
MSELLGEARILIRPDTTAFRAQLEEQLAFARKPVVIPVTAGTGGTGAFTAAQKEAEASALGLADAAQVQASALGRDAVILGTATEATAALAGAQTVTAARTAALTAQQKEQAAAALVTARRTTQLEHGVASTTLSQFGLRGATLAASGAFIAGAAAVTLLSRTLKEAVGSAEDLELSTERLKETVGDLTATQVTAWAGGLANSLGIAKVQAVDFAATLLALFKNFGVTGQSAVGMSEELIKVAGNLSLIQHVPVEAVLTGIQRGLAGNGRALRAFNIFVDQSRVAQEALVETGKQQASQLTRSELVTARYNIILRDSADRMDAFSVSSHNLTAQQRILAANVKNAETEIGGPLVFALNAAITSVNNLISDFTAVGGAATDLAGKIPFLGTALDKLHLPFQKVAGDAISLGVRAALLGPALGIASVAFDKIRDHTKHAGDQLSVFDSIASNVTKSVEKLADALNKIPAAQAKRARGAATGLEFQQLKIQTGLAPGGRSAEEDNLRAQIEQDKKIVALSKSGTKARRDALNALHGDQEELKALIAQDAADAKTTAQQAADAAKSAADAAKAAAEKLAQSQADATTAFVESFSRGQERLQNRLSLATTPTAQLNINKQIVIAFRNEIEAIRKRIRDMHLHGQAIQIAKQAIHDIGQEIFKTRNDIRDETKQAAQDRTDTASQILQINIQIAQTSGNKAAQARADKAYIAFLDDQIRKAKGNRLKIKQLKLERAQTEADLNSLNQQTQKGTSAAQALAKTEFAFLQTLQGFGTNLIGNLIPGGSTGGLVGGTTGPVGASQPKTVSLGGAAGATAGVRPVSSGQGNTQITLLREILHALHQGNRGREHPEARREHRVGAAAIDYATGGTHGM